MKPAADIIITDAIRRLHAGLDVRLTFACDTLASRHRTGHIPDGVRFTRLAESTKRRINPRNDDVSRLKTLRRSNEDTRPASRDQRPMVSVHRKCDPVDPLALSRIPKRHAKWPVALVVKGIRLISRICHPSLILSLHVQLLSHNY